MPANEQVKCQHHVDPKKCGFGKASGTTIYCQFDKQEEVRKRHPETLYPLPEKPNNGECPYPGLYGMSLTKKHKPYERNLSSLNELSLVINLPALYVVDNAVSKSK